MSEGKKYTIEELFTALRYELYGSDVLNGLSVEKKEKYYEVTGLIYSALEHYEGLIESKVIKQNS